MRHSGRSYLDIPAQQFLGEILERHSDILQETSLAVEEGDLGGVSGKMLGVKVLQGFEVIVDGVSHYNLPCEDLQDLE